ncbi:MAG: hypothetical protein IJ966_03970 [Bacilli bacterium]|jgi:hypothetical protein|nr:hypothetical protein [Bacilli bacterium]
MNKIIEIYKVGFIDGIKDAVKLNKKKNFKRINIKKILSKIYDLAYIEGYTKFIEK